MRQAGLSTQLRFSPQVLVVLLLAVPFFYCVREAIGAGIYAWYGSTYRKVEFVAEEARPNDGHPYAAGHIEPGGEPMNQPLLPQGDGWVLAEDPTVAFAPGTRAAMWWSPQAPISGYGRGRYTNGMLVARFPKLPGALGVVGWSFAALGVTWLTLVAIARIGGTRVYRSEIPLRLE
jgi:hypothetical protein